MGPNIAVRPILSDFPAYAAFRTIKTQSTIQLRPTYSTKYLLLTSIMTASDIIKDFKNRKLKPLYLLHGEEPYFVDRISDFAEHHLLTDAEKGFNQTVLYGKDTDIMTVLGAAKRYP